MSLLKTCQTCFHAKIRCFKTQDSGLCDRCLRLGKECVFNPARRKGAHRGATERKDGKLSPRPMGPSRSPLRAQAPRTASSTSSVGATPAVGTAFDPFRKGLLSLQTGKELLDYFTAKMVSHFPFVVLPHPCSVDGLAETRPCLCLATLAAASHGNMKLQRGLAGLFNALVASRVEQGPFPSLDLLQGLLVHVAWAHYHPRPRRYTQHLHLATSIVCDMRLDRPKRPKVWSVDGAKDKSVVDWNPDEMRALCGAYYLSSSSSVLLQKSRHFMPGPHVSECSKRLAEHGDQPTDKHLPYLIDLQRLIERLDDMVANESRKVSRDIYEAGIQLLTEQCNEMRSSVPFPLSESPPLFTQLSLLELLASQSRSAATPFGLDKLQDFLSLADNKTQLLDWLSTSMSSARSLISMVLVLPAGEEGSVSNIEWITVYCGLSLAVRLDLIAGHSSISAAGDHLRHFIGMRHTLRQVVMRLEAASGPDVDDSGDRDAFHHLARRARRLEEWYLERLTQEQPLDKEGQGEETHEIAGSMEVPGTSTQEMDALFAGGTAGDPQVDWITDFNMEHAGDLDISTFLFSDIVGFPMELDG